MVDLAELVEYLDGLLEVTTYADYAPNGLQVEGRARVERLVTGVTANQAVLDAASSRRADAVLVHHGYFWKGEDPRVVGMKRRRLATLLNRDMSLLAYHLPLDGHGVYGNNVQLAQRLGLTVEGSFGGQPAIARYGRLATPEDAEALGRRLTAALGRSPLHIAGGPSLVERVGWCSGAAQKLVDQAVAMRLDAFITGEVSEPTVHTAREAGIHFYAAGHHATERYGAAALGAHLAAHFAIEHTFVDSDNPV